MLRSSVNVSVGLAGVGGGSDVDLLVNMAGGNPRAKWQLAIQVSATLGIPEKRSTVPFMPV